MRNFTLNAAANLLRSGIRVRLSSLPPLLTALFLLGPSATGQQVNSCPKGFHTVYSRRATTLDGAYTRPVRVNSPDGTKELSVITAEDPRASEGLSVKYTVRVGDSTFEAVLPGFNGEVAWSPDSKAFAVNQTEGGGGIGHRVYVFYVDNSGMRRLDVSPPIETDFGNPVQCDVPVAPNTAFVAWRHDSSTLLVAAEVIPVSFCKCQGTYRVYEMKLPRLKIVKTYSQLEAKKKFWNELGCELRDADDSCVQALERKSRHLK